MEAAHSFVGIDVSKLKLDVALLSNGKVKSKVLDNSPAGYVSLLEWIAESKVDMESMYFCMEATGVYYEASALALHEASLKVSVVNPSCIKGFGGSENIRNKNDATDAGLIARYCAAMKPALWEPLPLEQRQLRAWSMRVQSLKDIRQQEENRREAHVVSGMLDVAAHVAEHVQWIDAQIAKLEKDIEDHIDRHPSLKYDADLIKSIPGIGATTVACIRGHLGISAALKMPRVLLRFWASLQSTISPALQSNVARVSVEPAARRCGLPCSCQAWWRVATTLSLTSLQNVCWLLGYRRRPSSVLSCTSRLT